MYFEQGFLPTPVPPKTIVFLVYYEVHLRLNHGTVLSYSLGIFFKSEAVFQQFKNILRNFSITKISISAVKILYLSTM